MVDQADQEANRKRKPLKLDFGHLTPKNVGQLKKLNTATFPVHYKDQFYTDLLKALDYCRLGFYADILVASICCRLEEREGEDKTGKALYIMSLSVLKPYQRRTIATQLVQWVIEQAQSEGDDVREVYLHVQTSNTSALAFYSGFGFQVTGDIKGYYESLEPPDCYVLRKPLGGAKLDMPTLSVPGLTSAAEDPRPVEAAASDVDGELKKAVCDGNVEVCRALLLRRAVVNYAHGEAGLTPLHFAAVHNHVAVARALLEAAADVKAVTKDDAGVTPAAIAESEGYEEMLELVYPAKPFLESGMKALGEGRYEDAMQSCQRALESHASASGYALLGDVCSAMERIDDAIAAYEQALRASPRWASPYGNLAMAYVVKGRHEEAWMASMQACALKPGDAKLLTVLATAAQQLCEWDSFHELRADLVRAVAEELDLGHVPEMQPWMAATYPLDADFALRLTRAHADHITKRAAGLGCPPLSLPSPLPVGPGEERLRIAYVCSEFGNHPVGQLMGSVFGLHDRAQFEVFVYSMGANDGSSWYKRIEASAEHFIDVSSWGAVQIAQRITADAIQIAVNINGFTNGARNEVFALRCAPMQIQFLGFPGTMAAQWVDYLVGDHMTSPSEMHHCYGEALAKMPHCMVPTDHKQAHSRLLKQAPPRLRAEWGLPEGEDDVVFCCHQQLFKVYPELFEVWCNILKRVPGSVLWLLRSPPAAEPRLRKEAEKRGIDPARLVFAGRASTAEYVRRLASADVFLDTPVYNAFTTGCDALWAGCPLVTLPLERMASRVASSLAAAVGLSKEMVVQSYQAYEDRAVELGCDHSQRRALRERLRDSRAGSPLYDTHMWVRDFERLLQAIWGRHASGEAPKTFALDPLPPPPAPRRPCPPFFKDPAAQNLEED